MNADELKDLESWMTSNFGTEENLEVLHRCLKRIEKIIELHLKICNHLLTKAKSSNRLVLNKERSVTEYINYTISIHDKTTVTFTEMTIKVCFFDRGTVKIQVGEVDTGLDHFARTLNESKMAQMSRRVFIESLTRDQGTSHE